MQIIGRAAIGFDGGRAGPQRVFVRAEFDHIIKARDMRRTPLIKVNLHNARLRCDLCHLALFLTLLPPFYRGDSGDARIILHPRVRRTACCIAASRPSPAQRKRPRGLHHTAFRLSTGEET